MKIIEKSELFDKLIKKANITQSSKSSEPFVELENAYRAYFTAFNNYTTDFFEKRLNENRIEDLKDMNLCLIRIINAIVSLAGSIDSSQPIIIGEANSNLINIVGIASNVLKRYNQLQERDNLLINIHSDFAACLKVLNDDIVQKYNGAHEQKLYTIEEAFAVYNQNTPREFTDLI
jgi:hypothetical protein